jgi:hypothetical protein
MTDPEREYFVQRIRDLEHSRGRWRLACLALLGVLLLPVVLGGLLGIAWVPRLERERARREAEQALYQVEIERANRALEQAGDLDRARQAFDKAEEALDQAGWKKAAEEATQQDPGKDKD